LSATQSVQVDYVPVALVHRYSFSETNGSTIAADSVAVRRGTARCRMAALFAAGS